jgi:hypothetical protein
MEFSDWPRQKRQTIAKKTTFKWQKTLRAF